MEIIKWKTLVLESGKTYSATNVWWETERLLHVLDGGISLTHNLSANYISPHNIP